MAKSGKVDEIKGRLEEAVGVLGNDEGQRRKGKADQSSGKVKAAESSAKLKRAGGKLGDAADEVKGLLKK